MAQDRSTPHAPKKIVNGIIHHNPAPSVQSRTASLILVIILGSLVVTILVAGPILWLALNNPNQSPLTPMMAIWVLGLFAVLFGVTAFFARRLRAKAIEND